MTAIRRVPRPARTLCGLVVAVVALTACGVDLQPGTAATVGDTSISQGEVDDLVAAACEYSEASSAEANGAEEQISIAGLRTGLVQSLITAELAEQAADDRGLTVNDSSVTELAAGSEMPEAVSTENEELLTEYFEVQARSQLQQAVVGAHLRDESITVADDTLTPDDVNAAQDALATLAEDVGVEVNPAYGSWDGRAVTAASGSLSDPVSDQALAAFADPAAGNEGLADLPASQVCG